MALELGVLLADAGQLGRALALVGEVGEAQLFLMDDGVLAASDPRLQAAIEGGLEVTLCAMDAEARGLLPEPTGPLFGSQWEHATMVRQARRIVAMTASEPRPLLDDHQPGAPGAGRRVAVRLTRGAAHPKTAQALRTAVAYAAADLAVSVLAEPAAQALLHHDAHDPALVRALATLRSLGHRLLALPQAGTRVASDLEVTW